MGVSYVTITIEEFENLIGCKRKLEEIRRLKDENVKSVKMTNMCIEQNMRRGNEERAKEFLEKQDVLNIIYIANIARVLRKKEDEKKSDSL